MYIKLNNFHVNKMLMNLISCTVRWDSAFFVWYNMSCTSLISLNCGREILQADFQHFHNAN